MTELREAIAIAEYISKSPPEEYGGFNPQTIQMAKQALTILTDYAEGRLVRPMEKETIRGIMRGCVSVGENKEDAFYLYQEGKISKGKLLELIADALLTAMKGERG